MASRKKGPTIIRYFAGIHYWDLMPLYEAIESEFKEGQRDFTILLATGGGSALNGLPAYNYLKGLPINLTIHNCGHVDSMGVVLFCAGQKRVACSQSSFLLHKQRFDSQGHEGMTELEVREALADMKSNDKKYLEVLSQTTGRSQSELKKLMSMPRVLSPEQALEIGLVHEIKETLFEGKIKNIIGLGPHYLKKDDGPKIKTEEKPVPPELENPE